MKAKIREILPTVAMEKKTYGPTVGVFRDISRLFVRFKASPIVKNILARTPAIETKIDQLKDALEDRLRTQYHNRQATGVINSKQMIDEVIKSLEIYVASVVYQDQSHCSLQSIETSLAQMVGIDIEELKQGCDEGLLGRVYSLSVALLADDNVHALDSYILQIQKNHLEDAIQQYITDNALGSSHAPVYAQTVSNYLNIAKLAGDLPKTLKDLIGPEQHMLIFFLRRYTAENIYPLI